jgi:hypothetical protein
MLRSRSGRAPLPLLAGFGLFVAVIGMLVAAPLVRRDPPTYLPTPPSHARGSRWREVGDTLTLDATDDATWRRASLSLGRALAPTDTDTWEIAAQRHRITVAGALADLGPIVFENARLSPGALFVESRLGETTNGAIGHWYRYGFVTHLLTSDQHVYALRTRDGRLWKIQILGYYCPGVVAGCLTLRYAPL